MTIFQALLLGLIQGLTEFFPVSSSTHLFLAKRVMGIAQNEAMIFFDLFCHLGTLLASVWILRREIGKVLTHFRSFAHVTLALCPLVPAYFLFKPLRETLSSQAPLLLLVTAAFLFLASKREQVKDVPKWPDLLCIGIAQGLALIPGISRCASTISTARILGWSWEDAVRFSFLLAIPAILGGTVLETLHLREDVQIPWRICMLGFSASFLAGLGAIRLLFQQLSSKTMRLFAGYCAGLGVLSYLFI